MFDERDTDAIEAGLQFKRDLQGMAEMAKERDDIARGVVPSAMAPIARLVPKNPVPKDETVVEFLRDLIGQIERGETDISEGFVIHYLASCGPKSTDPVKHHYWRYGMSQLRHLGLLHVGLDAVVREGLG